MKSKRLLWKAVLLGACCVLCSCFHQNSAEDKPPLDTLKNGEPSCSSSNFTDLKKIVSMQIRSVATQDEGILTHPDDIRKVVAYIDAQWDKAPLTSNYSTEAGKIRQTPEGVFYPPPFWGVFLDIDARDHQETNLWSYGIHPLGYSEGLRMYRYKKNDETEEPEKLLFNTEVWELSKFLYDILRKRKIDIRLSIPSDSFPEGSEDEEVLWPHFKRSKK